MTLKIHIVIFIHFGLSSRFRDIFLFTYKHLKLKSKYSDLVQYVRAVLLEAL